MTNTHETEFNNQPKTTREIPRNRIRSFLFTDID
jgi:hypothetical protein